MPRPWFTCAFIAAAALLLCGAAAMACTNGGGGKATTIPTSGNTPQVTAGTPLTTEEYFQRLSELNDQAALGLDAVNNDLSTALPTDRGLVALRASITQYAAVYQEFRDGLQQLSPPAELQATHPEAIDALTAFIDYSQVASAQAEDAQDIIDIAAIIDNEQTQTINRRLTDACEALQQAAAGQDITIDLACGEP